jgi:hypothetical protein
MRRHLKRQLLMRGDIEEVAETEKKSATQAQANLAFGWRGSNSRPPDCQFLTKY